MLDRMPPAPADIAVAPDSDPASAAEPARFSDLTRVRPFMQLWLARLLGTAAQQMLMVAIGWHMYDLTGSAWDLGLVGLYQFAPALLLALYAGHVVDRLHRGRILATCLGVQALVALSLLLTHLGGGDSRNLLLGVSLVLGAVRAFQMPAQQALTPLLVPPLMLPRAMAFSSAGQQSAIIGGPALGGLLFVAGMGAVYATCIGFLIVAVLLAATLRYAHAARPREPVTTEVLLAGVRFIWQRKPVLGAVSLGLFADLLGERWSCCRSSRRTSCMSAPGGWACCGGRRRWARWPRPSGSPGGRWTGMWAARCCWRSGCSDCAWWCSVCRAASGCR